VDELYWETAVQAGELARSRTSDERKAMDLTHLRVHWMINGKPDRQSQPKELTSEAKN